MPKPDPTLLDPARYPFSCEIETRFGDLDVNLHVNNVALAQICEEGRVRFHRASGYHSAVAGMTSMTASFAIEYLGQAFHPDPLEVHVAAERLGNTSYSLVQLLQQAGRAVAFSRSALVVMKEEQPVPIPEAFRDSVRPWMLRP
jgi:acyl-CoA thioester hydrolase